MKRSFTVERYVEEIEQLYQRIEEQEQTNFPPLRDSLKPIRTALADRSNKGGRYGSTAQNHL
ncbi:hypothetical protein JCM19238_4444 [Vibrio ponticus]|nr:hypothetical protein JCM19238_4444 [Vibrio ponticus]